MSIPMYFAKEWCEDNRNTAQLGFGFHKDGSLLVPKQLIPGAPIIINDAIIPERRPTDSIMTELRSLCQNGCFFDFERPTIEFHLFLKKNLPMAKQLTGAPSPINAWSSFCKAQETKYGTWAWEIIPWKKSIPFQSTKISCGKLKVSCCHYTTQDDMLIYYDCRDTLAEKLIIAEKYSCAAGIMLPLDYEKTQP